MPRDVDADLLHRLKASHLALTEALGAQDWDRIADIDQGIKETLRLLAQQKSVSQDVRVAKQQLQDLHSLAMVACAELCENLNAVLKTHLDHSEGRTAYERVDMLQGEK